MSLGFWLKISFVINYRGAFRSIVAIATDLLTSEDRFSSDSQLCLCRDGVYNPDNIRDRACAVLHSRWVGHPICDPSRIIATWFSCCSVNPLRPQNCFYLQSFLSCLYKPNCNIFNHHERLYLSLYGPAAPIHHFFWSAVITGDGRQRNQPRDCAMTWAFHVLQKMCRIKVS